MKIAIIIPARLSSTRFPNKILFDIMGLPMIEHVRKRCLLAKLTSDVYVATCDDLIADTVKTFGGEVVMTSSHHMNGTSRIAEAVKKIDCTHVVLVQGDEPLILPRHIGDMVNSIHQNPESKAWNAVSDIEIPSEMHNSSIVKCYINQLNNISFCFRLSPFISEYQRQKDVLRKMQGLIAFEKEYLIKLSELDGSWIEKHESIEQMRIIENNSNLVGVHVHPSLPSVNEHSDVKDVLYFLQNNEEQKLILSQYITIA